MSTQYRLQMTRPTRNQIRAAKAAAKTQGATFERISAGRWALCVPGRLADRADEIERDVEATLTAQGL